MKINKQFVQEVANGKYKEYDSHGEMQRAAQRILDEKVVSKFQAFCFSVYGKEMPGNVMDVYDAFVDFAIHGSEVSVWNTKENDKVYKFNGMTERESLRAMNAWVWDVHKKKGYEWLEDCEFKIRGISGKYHLSLANFHYCFVKGRISEEKLLNYLRVA